MTRCRVVLWTSTIGVSPVTVTVSSIEPTRKSALTLADERSGESMPSALDGGEAGQRECHGVRAGRSASMRY